MKARSHTNVKQIRAIKVHQWLDEWEKVHFQPKKYRAKPQPHFYLFSLNAHELKALSGIERRTISGRLGQKEDLGIQRRHDPTRSDEIRRFVEFGYPWSELSEAKRNSGEYDDLRKPGWLPTAVVVNILGIHDHRRGHSVNRNDLITVHDDNDSSALVVLPPNFTGAGWRPSDLAPIEVIDGQHRLWAFESDDISGKFDIPVVAFSGLDLSWQAYQFWTINIKPKRINPSLAFDLYPLLRTEDWLEKFEGHPIYRENALPGTCSTFVGSAREPLASAHQHARRVWIRSWHGESGVVDSFSYGHFCAITREREDRWFVRCACCLARRDPTMESNAASSISDLHGCASSGRRKTGTSRLGEKNPQDGGGRQD